MKFLCVSHSIQGNRTVICHINRLLIGDIVVTSYNKCSNCCPFTGTAARRRLLHSWCCSAMV